MTSEATMESTKTFFVSHNYFGLSSENVKFFEQFTLPCTDFEGKVLLAQKHKIACSPGIGKSVTELVLTRILYYECNS